MDIPHIDEIREHRQTLEAAKGVGELLQKIQSTLMHLGVARNDPADTLPGDELMAILATRPGLEGLSAVDAPPDAEWSARVAARDMALRSADSVLRPLYDDAHVAHHAIEDLRKAQFKSLEADPDLYEEVVALNQAAVRARNAIPPVVNRQSKLGPAEQLLITYTEKLERALGSTAPIRDALAQAFAQSAREGMDRVFAELGLPDRMPDASPEEVLAALKGWHARVDALAESIEAELQQAQAAADEATAAIVDRLG